MNITVNEMIGAARNAAPKISPQEAQRLMAGGGNTFIIDVRDANEVNGTGKIQGAVNISRGMLEFRADPATPYYDRHFAEASDVIVYCASGARSALCAKTLKDMGYTRVFDLGALQDWIYAGGMTE